LFESQLSGYRETIEHLGFSELQVAAKNSGGKEYLAIRLETEKSDVDSENDFKEQLSKFSQNEFQSSKKG